MTAACPGPPLLLVRCVSMGVVVSLLSVLPMLTVPTSVHPAAASTTPTPAVTPMTSVTSVASVHQEVDANEPSEEEDRRQCGALHVPPP